MNEADVIRGAMELLPDEDYWWQSGARGNNGRRYATCLSNALAEAGDDQISWNAHQFVAEELGLPPRRLKHIWEWNDDPSTTFEDVRLVLKRALERAEER